MHYLFLGTDTPAKDRKILEVRQNLLKSPDALSFDYESLYAQNLDSETLKKSLVALPAIAPQRLVVIRQGHKLSQHNKGLVQEFFEKMDNPVNLILESGEWEEQDSFVKVILKYVKVLRFGHSEELNVFALTRAIGARKKVEALSILSNLLDKGDYPLQIMGGMVWSWKKSREQLPKEAFQQGLIALKEADFNIKRSRLKPEHALEVLVIKLCS